MNHWNLVGKTALIVGASKGIGKATTEELLHRGAEVIFVARSANLIKQLEEAYQNKGWKATGIVADIGEASARQSIFDAVNNQWGRLDILVNNVGTNVRKPTLEATFEDLQHVMDINVGTAFDMSTKLYPLLKKSGSASVINVASIAAKTGVMWTTAIYAMSKAAMDRMTKYLAVDWGKDNIRVNSVNPWFINTSRVERVLKVEEKVRQINQATPLGRVGEPEEVARVIAFLAMPASSYLSGLNIRVDGAFSQVGIQ
jgi:Tropinone reductase 1